MLRRISTSLAPALLLLVAAGFPALAQSDRTGLIDGTVSAPGGAAVEGAVVTVARSDGTYAGNAVTDESGRFRIGFLPPGRYDVLVQAPGFRPQSTIDVRVSAGTATPLTVALPREEGMTETVTVRASAPVIDQTTTDLGTTLGSEATEVLPSGRNATSLVKFTPGATNGEVWGGSTSQANSYQIDGVSVNDPGFGGDFLLPNIDWIEEFQVRGLGAGAEYGNFTGGQINIVTKSGSNTFTGAIRTNFEDESFNASNANVEEAGTEQDNRFELNASVGGPIVKDKLFYFVSAQEVSLDTRVVDVAAPGTGVSFLPQQEERTERKLFGKLTWQATEKDKFDLVLGIDDVETDNRGLNSFDDPASATRQESPGSFYNLSWARTFSGNSFLEVKATGFEGDDDRLPLNGNLAGVQLLGGNRNLFRNAVYTRTRTRENRAFAAQWDSYWQTGGLLHHVKVGGDWDNGTWDERRRRNQGLTWRPDDDQVLFDPDNATTWDFISSDWGGGIDLDAEVTNAALYVQDYLRINDRLAVNFGLRYGMWEGELTPGFGGGPTIDAIDDTAFDPRFGLTWDLFADDRWVVKGHWGRYHQNLFSLFFDRVEGGNVFQDIEFWDWVGDGTTPLPDLNRPYTLAERDQLFTFFGSVPTGQETGPIVDYEQPYVDQIVVGLEHALGERWKAGLTYVRRDFEEIVALVDRNLDSNYTRYFDVEVFDFPSGDPVLDASGSPLVLPELYVSNDDILFVGSAPDPDDPSQNLDISNLTFDQDLVLTNAPDAERTFDQIQLTFERRATDSFWFNGSIVWTEFEGNFFSVNGYDDPGGTGAGPYVRPNEQINFFGDLPADELEIKVSTRVDLPWKFRLGAFLLHTSGERFTPSFEVDRRTQDFALVGGPFLDPDLIFGIDGQSILLERRGNREYDSATTLDLHIDRPLQISRTALTIGVDVFNVFNEDAVISVASLVNNQDPADPTTLFGAPRLRVAPRTVRVGATLSW